MRQFFSEITTHANSLEFVQFIAALVGTCFSIWAMMDAVKDSMALTMSGANGPRKEIATGNMFSEFERFLVQILLLGIGYASLFLEPPYFEGQAVPPAELLQHTITRLGLVTITVFKMFGGIWARRSRNRFVRKMTLLGKNPATPPCFAAPPPGQPTGGVYPEILDLGATNERKDHSTEPRQAEVATSAKTGVIAQLSQEVKEVSEEVETIKSSQALAIERDEVRVEKDEVRAEKDEVRAEKDELRMLRREAEAAKTDNPKTD